MLVLSRKIGESVIIGGNITVTVIQTKGDRVRIGIEAPIEVPVHRDEVFQRIKEEEAKEEAKGTNPVAA